MLKNSKNLMSSILILKWSRLKVQKKNPKKKKISSIQKINATKLSSNKLTVFELSSFRSHTNFWSENLRKREYR